MAAYDIMPFRSPMGGGADTKNAAILGTTAAFLVGEPVRLDANGNLVESTDQASGLELGIGPGDTSGVDGVAAAGAVAAATAFGSDGTVATAQNEGVKVGYYPFDSGAEFVTRNFATTTDGVTTGVADDTSVGDLCGIVQDGSGNWGISTDAGVVTEQHFVITRVIRGRGTVGQGRDQTDQDAAAAAQTNLVVFRRRQWTG